MIRCSLCKGYDVNRTTCKMYYVVIKCQSTRECVCVCVCAATCRDGILQKDAEQAPAGDKETDKRNKKKGCRLDHLSRVLNCGWDAAQLPIPINQFGNRYPTDTHLGPSLLFFFFCPFT